MSDEFISIRKKNSMLENERASITKVEKGSIAEESGIEVGDKIVSINGHAIKDIIDYQFMATDSYLEVEILKKNGDIQRVEISKEDYEGLGLTFAAPTFDGIRRCANKCIFCFVHQLPKGLRDALYIKDDDYRLSFLEGNFITLTNMREKDWRRIGRLRLSPLYISVHTTSSELRIKMLNNPAAGDIYNQLRRLASLRIEFHTQIVLCPGINDGEELKKTIDDLITLRPYIKSIGIVPVGLSKYREGLFLLKSATKEVAREVVMYVQEKANEFKRRWGYPFVFLADEFYQLAEMPLPPSSSYEEFPQLENGIGLIRSFEDDFFEAWNDINPPESIGERHISLVTGVAGAQIIDECIQKLKTVKGFNCVKYVVINRTFGDTITVTGLLTGKDIVHELKGKELGSLLLIPSVMLRKNDRIFLDDMTVERLQEILKVPIIVVNGAREFIEEALGLEVIEP